MFVRLSGPNCLELSIFVSLAQVYLRYLLALSGRFQVSLRSGQTEPYNFVLLFYRKCSGLNVNSYKQNYDTQKNRLFEKRLSKSLEQYKHFKRIINIPPDFDRELKCQDKSLGDYNEHMKSCLVSCLVC